MPPFPTNPPGPRSWSVLDALPVGWRAMSASYWPLVAMAAVVTGVGALSVLVAIWAPIAGIPLQILLSAPLWAGMAYAGVRLAHRQPAPFPTLWAAFDRYREILIISLVAALPGILRSGAMYILTAAGPIAPRSATPHALLLTVVSLAGMLVETYIAIRLMFAPIICLDQGRAAPDALSLSWRWTGPLFWPLLGFSMLMGLIFVASLLALGVGVVFLGLPFYAAAIGQLYVLMTRGLDPAVCAQCGFDLTGLPTRVCPECGVDQADLGGFGARQPE